MTVLQQVCGFLEQFAPRRLAEDWDNVGLLVGDRAQPIERIMTCLTITPASVAEAIRERAQLIVAHHPLPFRPLKTITSDTVAGRMLLELIRGQVAIYSPHTSFDSAAVGINQQLAEGLGLTDIQPLQPRVDDPDNLGAGRKGAFAAPLPVREVVARLKTFLRIDGMHLVGDDAAEVRTAAVACGSAGSFLDAALRAKCDLFVTGETTFHTCLEAESRGIALLLPGHYATERFAVEQLAGVLQKQFPELQAWASVDEADPLTWI
ncbi:Nif3-like dinuclear metal center hexameric protein [Lignipirellula cremea]|uniref:GTP cyclohydrolase 1 type 2 homolog n=1 Tax=Lignipirellula cremea TaxID=2528010 RepID=A0A518DNU5_9BACT|nr:Nif3-like dinuclear metal center hexameric protein [Lignipirellula cremea]QDU93512.1 Putative GTP cyclohydrolase 1 type 2 [Lignipirellula cremea]